MKKLGVWVAIGGVAVVMAWLLVSRKERVAMQNEPQDRPATQMRYAQYRGTDPALHVTFQYPEGWIVQEERGQVERYTQVRIMGPRNHDDSYSCYLAVQGLPLQALGGKFHTADEFVRNYTTHLIEGATLVSERKTTISDVSATDLVVSYTLPPWHHRDLKPVEVPVKTRTVILEKSPYLYQLTFSADAREYDLHANAFDRLLNSFRVN